MTTIPRLARLTRPLLMRALSIRQPWAWAIATGLKDVENRSWPTDYRGPFLIHAGKAWAAEGEQFMKRLGIEVPSSLLRGGVVGEATLVDCVRDHPSVWAIDGHWHFLLAEACDVEFRPMAGKLRWFEVA
jgi:ASCH domain